MHPSDSLSIIPLTLLRLSLFILEKIANCVLLVVFKFTVVDFSIGPSESTLTLSFAVCKLASIFFAVSPSHLTMAMHHVVFPFAIVEPLINKSSSALAI